MSRGVKMQKRKRLGTFPYNYAAADSAVQFNCSESATPARTRLAISLLCEGRHVGYTASGSVRKPHHIMNNLRIVVSLIVCSTVGFLMIGCSHLSLPVASRYSVVCGQVTYSVSSVKAHGNWIELQTDEGLIWFNRDAVTSIRPSR